MNDMIYFTISYAIVFFGSFLFINFLTNGFVFKFIPIRVSRGRKVLVLVHGLINSYFAIGFPNESTISYKDGKLKKDIACSSEDFQNFLGCKMLEIDSKTNAIRKADFTTYDTYDATTFDNLLNRQLTMPNADDKILKIVLIMVIVVAIICAVIGFKILTFEQLINSIPKIGVV